MATRKITRKVITPVKPVVRREQKSPAVDSPKVEERIEVQPEEVEGSKVEGTGPGKTVRAKKECFFCHSKTSPSYTDLGSLRRYLTDRAKIVSKERSGVCSRHQRAVSKNIKYARHLALLPFVPKV